MKRVFLIMSCLFVVMAVFTSLSVYAQESEHISYTQDDNKKEFRVYDADGLMEVARVINAGGDTYATYNIFIDADINMSGKIWKPIAAAQANNYRGTFDGQGHTITGLAAYNYSNSLGLIGYAGSGVVVKDVHLVGVSFHSAQAYNGVLIGRLENIVEVPEDAYALITGCTVQGTLSTTMNYAGGLVGAIHNGKAVKIIEKDAEGNDVEVDRWIPANLRVENCAVNMNLSATTNYAAGILAGDSFLNDDAKSNYKLPTVVCKNVFVTGSYKSRYQASGFIGYINKADVTIENCISAANVEGDRSVSGSFFGRIRKSNITVRECYSISDVPFCGEIENLASLRDADGNVLDMITINNSYFMKSDWGVNPICTKLTTLALPEAPAEGASAEEIAAYEEALALYNNLVIVNINAEAYKIADIATLEVPFKHQQQLIVDCARIAPTLFAAGSKQMELFNAYLTAMKCDHTTIRELATSLYIATNATCSEQATYYQSCAICGEAMKETFPAGETAPHTWADRWDSDETNHFHACSVCGEAATDVSEHTYGEWEVVKAATFECAGREKRCCTVCLFEQEREIPKLECEHSYDNVWFRDSANHWQVCIKCNNATPEFEAHIFGEWEVVNAATFECVGKEKRCCTVCLFEQEREIPKLECEHSYDNIWFRDSTNHWHVCTQCGLTKEGVENHTFGNWIVEKEPSNSKPGKMARQCTACKYLEEAVMYTSSTGCKSSIVGEGVVMLFVTICAFVIRKKED